MKRLIIKFESIGPSRNKCDRCQQKNADCYAVTHYLDNRPWDEQFDTRMDGYYCDVHAKERLKELKDERP
jgi:hypothetical protein